MSPVMKSNRGRSLSRTLFLSARARASARGIHVPAVCQYREYSRIFQQQARGARVTLIFPVATLDLLVDSALDITLEDTSS